MYKFARLLCAAIAVFPSACATQGGGPFGIVAFDSKHHVSGPEPLFGLNDEHCLDDPTFMLTLFTPDVAKQDAANVDVCTRMKRSIAWGLLAHRGSNPNQLIGDYSQRDRNEVIDAMMAASDRKCGRYIAFLQQYDGNINSTFGIGAQAAAILATVVSAGAAPWFAAGAGIAGGTRGTLNEAHFNNQTVGVLVNAFEGLRQKQREAIAELETQNVENYSVMRGIQDATRYHASCTIVQGLKSAQRNVEEARSPSLDSFKAMLKDLKEIKDAATKAGVDMDAEPGAADGSNDGAAGTASQGFVDADAGSASANNNQTGANATTTTTEVARPIPD